LSVPAAVPETLSMASSKDVAEWLRGQIAQGHLVPGQRVVEADVIRDTGASRGRVREAIQRLEAEGLLIIEEFRGASVRRFSEDDMRQIYRTRMALEGLAAHDFALRGVAAEKNRLGLLQDQMNRAERKGDHAAFASLNDEWHGLILTGSGNAYAKAFVDRLGVPIRRQLFATFYSAHRIDQANNDHSAITAAIRKGEADKAEKLMRAHIEKGLTALLEISRRRP